MAVAVDEYIEAKVRMQACHESQFFEWLAFNSGNLDQVPQGEAERFQWLFERRGSSTFLADSYREKLIERYGPERGKEIRQAEVFEICEYGTRPDADLIEKLFPK